MIVSVIIFLTGFAVGCAFTGLCVLNWKDSSTSDTVPESPPLESVIIRFAKMLKMCHARNKSTRVIITTTQNYVDLIADIRKQEKFFGSVPEGNGMKIQTLKFAGVPVMIHPFDWRGAGFAPSEVAYFEVGDDTKNNFVTWHE